MRAYVYILEAKNRKYYVGSTGNLDVRLREHMAGKTRSLRNIRPLKLAFAQEFDNIFIARKIEKRLKKFKNRNVITKIIADGKITMGL